MEHEYGKENFIYAQYFEDCISALKDNQDGVACLSIDLIMPKSDQYKYKNSLLNGLNALREVRDSYPNLPIVVYTVVSDEASKKDVEDLKALYISKNDGDGFKNLFEFFKRNVRKEPK